MLCFTYIMAQPIRLLIHSIILCIVYRILMNILTNVHKCAAGSVGRDTVVMRQIVITKLIISCRVLL